MVETYPPTHARFDARANLWWLIAAIGMGLLVLAYVIAFFNNFDGYRDEAKAPAVFQMLGILALTGGLTLGALLMTGASWALRFAMLVAAGVFLLGIGGAMPVIR